VGAAGWVIAGLHASGAFIIKDHVDQENPAQRREELTASCEAEWTDADLTIPPNRFDTPEFSVESMRHHRFISQCERVGPENADPKDFENGARGSYDGDEGDECQNLEDCGVNVHPGEEASTSSTKRDGFQDAGRGEQRAPKILLTS
jgi:hypothetical protein